MNGKRLSAGLLFLCFAWSAGVVSAEEAGVKLKEVVVTATKTEKEPQDLTQSVTIISAEEIEKSGALTASGVIEQASGVHVNENGPAGSLSSITIRGASYQQVLVLLDGRRLNSASAGGFDLSDLPVPLDEIERIEIVRGPASALYGADAVGGVVNIITKKPTAAATTVTGAVGSHGYQGLALGNSNRVDKMYYTLSVGKVKSDGFRENSDLDQTTAGAKVGYEFTSDSSLELSADYIEKAIGAPGSLDFPNPVARQWDRNAGSGLTYRTKPSKELDFRVSVTESRDTLLFADPSVPTHSKDVSSSTGGEAQANWLVNSWNLLTFGVEARDDRVENSDFGTHSASLAAGYLQDEMTLGEAFIVVVGGRNDSHSVYGDRFSPKASARFLVKETGTIVRASAGNSFRAPTFNDLYFLDAYGDVGNPNLKPETAVEYEGGVEQPFGKGNSVAFASFVRTVNNMIQWEPVSSTSFIYSPANIGRARISGYEAEAKFVLAEILTWLVNFSYLDAVDETSGNKIYYTPEDQLKSSLSLALPTKTNITFEGRMVRNYVKPGEPTWRYTVADGKISQPVTFGREVKGDVFLGEKNIFDYQYQVVKGYPMPPAEIYGGVSIRF